jgi:hypothetical protein
MLTRLITVLTASVSLAGCNTGSNANPANQPHMVNRPIVNNEPNANQRFSGTPDGQAGSATTTEAIGVNRANAEPGTTATGVGSSGPGNTVEGTSARSGSLDSTPARGATKP